MIEIIMKDAGPLIFKEACALVMDEPYFVRITTDNTTYYVPKADIKLIRDTRR